MLCMIDFNQSIKSNFYLNLIWTNPRISKTTTFRQRHRNSERRFAYLQQLENYSNKMIHRCAWKLNTLSMHWQLYINKSGLHPPPSLFSDRRTISRHCHNNTYNDPVVNSVIQLWAWIPSQSPLGNCHMSVHSKCWRYWKSTTNMQIQRLYQIQPKTGTHLGKIAWGRWAVTI